MFGYVSFFSSVFRPDFSISEPFPASTRDVDAINTSDTDMSDAPDQMRLARQSEEDRMLAAAADSKRRREEARKRREEERRAEEEKKAQEEKKAREQEMRQNLELMERAADESMTRRKGRGGGD